MSAARYKRYYFVKSAASCVSSFFTTNTSLIKVVIACCHTKRNPQKKTPIGNGHHRLTTSVGYLRLWYKWVNTKCDRAS
jgi:hypothetical protein